MEETGQCKKTYNQHTSRTECNSNSVKSLKKQLMKERGKLKGPPFIRIMPGEDEHRFLTQYQQNPNMTYSIPPWRSKFYFYWQ